jgi:transcriptional regulator with XRE-family HTH domain
LDEKVATLPLMSKDLDDFGTRLLQACRHAGVAYSQSAIGHLIDTNKQTVENWMKGTVPRADTLFRLADALEVDARWLATGAGIAPGDSRQHLRPASMARVNERVSKDFVRKTKSSRKPMS